MKRKQKKKDKEIKYEECQEKNIETKKQRKGGTNERKKEERKNDKNKEEEEEKIAVDEKRIVSKILIHIKEDE